MDGIPTVGNVVTILGLEFVCFLPNNLGDLVGFFPGRTKLAGTWVFSILEDSAQHSVSSLECSSSDILVVVLGHLLVVGCSPETSHVPQLINRVKVVIELLPVGILVEPLVLEGLDPCFNKYDGF